MREQAMHDSSDEYSYDEETLEEIRYGNERSESEWEWCPGFVRGPLDLSWAHRSINEEDEEDRLEIEKEYLDRRIEKREDAWCDS